MADLVERLLPDRLCVLFRRMVSRAGAKHPRGGSDHRLHPESADEAAVRVVIVAAIAEHNVGAAPGSTALAPHRGHSLQQGDELGDVLTIAAGQRDGKRNPSGIRDQKVLTAALPRPTGLRPVLEPSQRPAAEVVFRSPGEVQGVHTAEFSEQNFVQAGPHPGFGLLGPAAPARHARAEAELLR